MNEGHLRKGHAWRGHPAYEAGRKAAASGLQEHDNPHDTNAPWEIARHFYAWRWGWCDEKIRQILAATRSGTEPTE